MYTATGSSSLMRANLALAHSENIDSFGYWVRRRRLALDLTQAELARKVNCARVTIVKIERDERRPSRQMARLLAASLAIPADQTERFIAAGLGERAVAWMVHAEPPLAMPRPAPAATPPTNLPTPATPFVGRQLELNQLCARLDDPTCQLLTLLGPGGFGKTRLALRLGELALERPQRFPDGVYWVALDGLESLELVAPAIAAAIGFTFYEQQAQASQLLAYLAGKQMLLILDNAEGMLDPDLVERLLTHAPGVKLVVTTREALKLQQEWLNPIGGMRVDAGGEDGMGAPPDLHADAIALFQQCAQRAHPDFDLARVGSYVQQICRIVDGAPLAIELAAAWLKALPCEQVLRELTDSNDLLATSLRNVPARHRSMRAVLDQSWRHLTAEEQRVFRQLSVFEGGFRLAAAQTIVQAPLWVLASLVEKAMLYLAADGRYRIHPLLQRLGAEYLAQQADELTRGQAQHCAYFVAFVTARSGALAGPDQRLALHELQDDWDNLRAAWLYAAQHGRLAHLRGALAGVFRFRWMQSRYAEGERLAMQALASPDAGAWPDEERAVRVALLAYRARFAATLGAHDQAHAWAHVALQDALQFGMRAELALGQYVTGLIEAELGHGDRAIEHLERAYQLYGELGDTLGMADAALRLAASQMNLKSQFARAGPLVAHSVDLYRTLGDRYDMAEALEICAWLSWMAGDPDAYERLSRECWETAHAAGNWRLAASVQGSFALVAAARGQWDAAIALMQEQVARRQRLGHVTEIKHALNFLCGIYAEAGRYTSAMALLTTYPDMWRTPWTAQAQIGAGAFGEAMRYLPQETADKLAMDHGYDMALYLVAWAMLLDSECELAHGEDALAGQPLLRAERTVLAYEVLSAVQASEPRDPARHTQVERLLANLREKAGDAVAGYPALRQPVRSIRELAQAMLAIRICG